MAVIFFEKRVKKGLEDSEKGYFFATALKENRAGVQCK
jgi:hypothetical protein